MIDLPQSHFHRFLNTISLKQAYIALLCTACFVNLLLYHALGIKVVNDSPRYLEYASHFFEGHLYEPHNFWYVGYVFFISLARLLSTEPWAIILLQSIFFLIGLSALFYASFLQFKHPLAALLSGLGYLFFLELPSWNFYVLAESLYGSMLCVCLLLLILFVQKRIGWQYLLIPFCFTFFIKPSGIALMLASLSFFIVLNRSWLIEHKTVSAFFLGLSLIGSITLLNQMLSSFADSIIYNDYTKGEIIYGITSLKNHPDTELLTVRPKHSLQYPPQEGAPLMRLLIFILSNSVHFFKLWAGKLFFYLSHLRPYYSTIHNLFTILYLYPAYGFAIFALKHFNFPLPLKAFFIAFTLIHIAIVTLTTVDYDGRFIVPLLPFLFFLFGGGVKALLFQSRKTTSY